MPLDHKYGAQHSLKIFLSEIYNISSKMEFVAITGTYGTVNDFCKHLGIENYVIKHDYAIYGLMRNKVLQKLKRTYKKVKVGLGYISAIKEIEKKLDVRSFDLIYAGINRDLLGIFLAKKYKKPLVMHLHEFNRGHFAHDILYKNQIQLMNQYASSFISISNAVFNDWKSAGLDSNKITVVYNGMIPNEVKPSVTKNESKVLKVIMIGGMYEQKGQEQLIRAIAELGDEYRDEILVDFYGDGKDSYLQKLKKLIEKNDLSDICAIKGYDPNVRQRLGEYDVGVVCSKAEGFGMVTVEYMMAGLCPVVSDTGANTEIVEADKTGLVYRYGDAGELSVKIQYLINHPVKRNEMAERARCDALERFNGERYAMNVLSILHEACLR